MAVDRNSILKEILVRLTAAAPVTVLLGSPPRVYFRPPESVIFPWVRMDMIPVGRLTGTLGGGVKPNWIRQMTVQFTAYALETTLAKVTAIQKALADVMDKFPGLAVITGCKIGQCLPGAEFAGYSIETKTAYSVLEYTLSFEDTT